MYDVEALRALEFPLSDAEIYFNHAAISPLPQRTKQQVEWATAQLAGQPSSFFEEYALPHGQRLRLDLAAFINAASPEEMLPITTTSAALNAVAQSLPLEAGDNVLFCEVEFPSNAFPWMALERYGVEARQVPAVNGGLTLEALEPLVDERTRLVAASAIQFHSGQRTNMRAIGAFCREQGILFAVDAIQASGHMPFDVQAMQLDVLASGGQKSLLAPPGIGFLYVRQEVAERLRPRAIGPTATRDFLHWLDYDLTPLPGAARFDMGTHNVIGEYGLGASLELLQELGLANIEQHTVTLAAEAIALFQRLGYEVLTPPGHGPIVTFDPCLQDAAADEVVRQLHAQQVTISKRWDATRKPFFRLSFHAYNTAEELRRFEQKFVATMKLVQ